MNTVLILTGRSGIGVEAYLVQATRERLEGLGRRPRMVVADATGELSEGEYNRMMQRSRCVRY